MYKTRKTFIICGITAMVVFAIAFMTFFAIPYNASADETENDTIFNYKLITSEEGQQSYSVAIKPASKPAVEKIIIPNTYNGIPVTEIANNGFVSCSNLKTVVLPASIKVVGKKAFMNCRKLVHISLPAVESIGADAFALCSELDSTYMPKSIKSVEANIFRNNSNTVYIQSSESDINAQWQATWSDYFTGDIRYDVDSKDMIEYTPIFDESYDNVIGYELNSGRNIADAEADIVIYNAIKTEENPNYLPVLNVCSDAFDMALCHSITFKDIRVKDPAAPEFKHKINIRSNAFYACFIDEVRFDVDITFEHPRDLQSVELAEYDNSEIVGDEYNQSTRVFAESTIKKAMFLSELERIGREMFLNCPDLKSIEYSGHNDVNVLYSAKYIGDRAFASCSSISELYVPSTVNKMGQFVFDQWGTGGNHQTLHIDFYEGYYPDGWANNWCEGIETYAKLTIQYKDSVEIFVDMQDGQDTILSIGVKPGLEMPELAEPQRNGYIFKGIYAEKDGNGWQYYTNDMRVNRIWQEGDPTTLYANWELVTYNIIYPDDIKDISNANPRIYTIEDRIEIKPIQSEGYEYKFEPNVIEKGTYGDLQINYTRETVNYKIEYDFVQKGNIKPERYTYTVEDEFAFENLVCEGYTFAWSPAGVSKGSIGDLTVVGIWTPVRYHITYNIDNKTENPNPDTYTYGQELVLSPAVRGGYTVEWNRLSIPAGTIGDITVDAVYTEKTLAQCYKGGVYEIWTLSQLKQFAVEPNGGNGRTYRLMDDVSSDYYAQNNIWTPISKFYGVFDGNGHGITSFALSVTSSGSFGFCNVNYGTIKNLTLGFRFTVGGEYSNVNIGSFAGINEGTISDCNVAASFNRPFFKCYAKGDSYMGCFVGINRGTIENCNSSDYLQGSCNMGSIAGANTHIIRNCHISDAHIYFDYADYNADIGGIVGRQDGGSVENCYFSGSIQLYNYYSEQYDSQRDDREMHPCIGIIVGRRVAGATSGNAWEKLSYLEEIVQQKYNQFAVVTWTAWSGLKKVTYTNNQGEYVKNEECGRIG